MNPRDFTPGDGHGYVEGVPYHVIDAEWQRDDLAEYIESREHMWPVHMERELDQPRESSPRQAMDGAAISPATTAVDPGAGRALDQSQEGEAA